MRYKLIIEYDGTNFFGLQRQADAPTIQATVEDAIFKFCQERVTLHVAGRTDAGVHARAMVTHFESPRVLDVEKMAGGLNFYLHNRPITILSATLAADDFHARFSAKSRAYEYRIVNRRAPLAIDDNRAWHVIGDLDVTTMQAAAQHLIGTHDFSTFRDSDCQGKTPIKTVTALHLDDTTRQSAIPELHGRDIVLFIRARSFLHHMVRNITGSLVQVGLGKWSVEDFIRARDAKDRKMGGPTAPSCGLYFLDVEY